MSKPASCCSFAKALCLLCLWAAPAAAVTYRVPSVVSSVGAALALAGAGDTVLVAPGTYYCSAVLNSGASLVGAGTSASVVLDAQGQGPVLRVTDASGQTLVSGVTLQGGLGLLVDNAREGGGIFALRSSAVISGVRITGCGADVGAGAYFEQGAPSLRGCRIDHNQGEFGAGVALNHCNARFDTCRVLSNAAGQGGGGLLAINGSSAAVYLGEISDNSSGGDGGGVYTLNSTGNFLQVTLRGNAATGDGGGAYCGEASTVDFTGDVFWKNTAARGGGAYLGCAQAAGRPRQARPAARTSAPCTVIQLTNNTLMENSATQAGGGVAVNDAAQLRLLNNIVALSPSGSGVACLDLRSSLDFRCNDVWRNTPGDWDASCGSPTNPGLNNLSQNPLFCDPASGNFVLCENSPLIGIAECFTTAIGAFEPGCPACATAVRVVTWGSLRRIYGRGASGAVTPGGGSSSSR